jgi:hypothetical protein
MSGIVRANNSGQSGAVTNVETIDSDDYVDASIDNAHLADNAVDTDEITDDAVTAAKLANSINTEIAANTGKTTNATHTGDVTGATALTIATDAVEGSMVHSNVVDDTTLEQSGTQFRIKDNAVTLAKMAGGTDGQIITYDASGDPVAVGPGSDGQVLTSTGTGSPPAFEDAGGGAWALLSSVEADDDAYIDLTGADTTKYGGYCVVMKGMRPATNAVAIAMQLGDSGGVDAGGSDYTYSAGHWLANYTGIQHSYDSSQFQMSYYQDAGNGGDDGYSGTAWVLPGTSGGEHGLTSWVGIFSDGACSKGTYYYGRQVGSGYRKSTLALTTVRIKFTSGNITSGIASLYGITE